MFRWHARIDESRLPSVPRLALSSNPLVAQLPESHSRGRTRHLERHCLQTVRDSLRLLSEVQSAYNWISVEATSDKV